MTVGIPGTGVGGLFYLAAAVLLPFRAIGRRLDAKPAAFKTAVRQAGLAVAMFAGMWATGWSLGLLFGPQLVLTGSMASRIAQAERNNFIQWAVLSLGYLILGVVLLTVQVARLLFRRRPPRGRRSGGHSRPAAALR